ncbi:MAG: ABC transporter permease [Pseudomonadota bacterium]
MIRGRLVLEPRADPGAGWRIAVSGASCLLALLLGAALLALSGVHPGLAYTAMLRASLTGGVYALSDTAVKATPLVLCGLGCALAFRARLWNVGAEGQLLLGAWAAAAVGSVWLPPETPRALLLLLMLVAAMTAGGAYAALAGWLRTRYQVSEILSTLMLVYVATHWNNFWIYGPWSAGGFPLTPLFPASSRLPRLTELASSTPGLAGITLHAGCVLAPALAVLMWWWLRRSRFGLTLEVVGASPDVARSSGFAVGRHVVIVLALSGALAGLAGMVEVSGVVFRLQERFSPGYGFTAIIVAWLARLHPVGVVLVGTLLAALLVGSREVQPAGIATMLQGLLLFVVVGADLLTHHRLRWRREIAHA